MVGVARQRVGRNSNTKSRLKFHIKGTYEEEEGGPRRKGGFLWVTTEKEGRRKEIWGKIYHIYIDS